MLDSNLPNITPQNTPTPQKEEQKKPTALITKEGLEAVNKIQDFKNYATEVNRQMSNQANANINPYAQFAAHGVNLGSSEKGGLNLERYYNRDAYKKLGFNPFIDNELRYQKNTTRWDDFTTSVQQSWNLAKLGFTSLWSSETDVEKAERYQRYANIGTSQREGALSRNFNNLVLNAGYTVGLLAEIALEEFFIGLATGGVGTPVVLGRQFSKAKNLSSAQRYMNAPLRTVNALQDLKNPSKAKAFWETTRKAATNVFPFANTVENATTWGRQMERLADGTLRPVSEAKKMARTFGAFYRDGREIALALDEAKLESGFAKNKVMDDLILKYQEENNGALPDSYTFNVMMEKAGEAASRAYWMNAFVIYGTNRVTFGNMFNKFQPRILRTGTTVTSPVAGGKLVKDFNNYTLEYIRSTGIFNVKGKATEIWKDTKGLFSISGLRKTSGASLGKALKYSKANFSEGIQEYLQEVIQEAETNRAKDRYFQTVRGSILENATEALSTADYYKNAFGHMWNAEGAEVFFSGFLMGGVAGPVSSMVGGVPSASAKIADYLSKSKEQRLADKNFLAAQQEKIQKKVDQFNDMTNAEKDFLINYMKHTAAQAEYAANMEETAENKDAKGFYDIKDAALADNILNAINLGSYDLFLEKVKDLSQLSEEDLRDAFKSQLADGDDKSISSFKERAQDIVEATELIKNFYDNNDKIFPEVADYGLEDSEFDMGITMKDLREARQSYIQYLTLNQYTLVRAIQRRKKLQESLLGENSPFNETDKIGPSSITHLMSDQMTAQEVKLLKDEIKMLEEYDKLTSEQKAELKEKKQSLESLTAIQTQILEYTRKIAHKETVLEFQKKAKNTPDALIGQQINYRTSADGKDKVGKITGVSFDENNVASFEVEYQDEATQKYVTETVKNDAKLIKELETDPDTVLKASAKEVSDSMKKYLKIIAKRNGTTVDATKVNDFLLSFIDARLLSLDEAMLAEAVEMLVMPENHAEYIKQYNSRTKRLRERMAETISSDLSAFYNSQDVADLLGFLGKEYSVFIAQEDLEKLIEDFNAIPENVYDLKTIMPLAKDSERYQKAVAKIKEWSEIKTTPETKTEGEEQAPAQQAPASAPKAEQEKETAKAPVSKPAEAFVKLTVSDIQNGTVTLPETFRALLQERIDDFNAELDDETRAQIGLNINNLGNLPGEFLVAVIAEYEALYKDKEVKQPKAPDTGSKVEEEDGEAPTARDFEKVKYTIPSDHIERLSNTETPKVVITADEYNVIVSQVKNKGVILKLNLSQNSYDIVGAMATEASNVVVDKLQFIKDLALPTEPTGAFTIPVDIGLKDESDQPVLYYTDKEEVKIFLEQDKGSLYIINLDIKSEITDKEITQILKLEAEINKRINNLVLGQEDALIQEIFQMYIDERLEYNEEDVIKRVDAKVAELRADLTIEGFEVGSTWKLKGSNSVWTVEKVTKNQVTFTDGNTTKKVNASDLKTKVLQKVDIENMEEEEIVPPTQEEQDRATGTQEEFDNLSKEEKDSAAQEGIAAAKAKIASGEKVDRKSLFGKDKLNPIC